jgi:hypothetical protein
LRGLSHNHRQDLSIIVIDGASKRDVALKSSCIKDGVDGVALTVATKLCPMRQSSLQWPITGSMAARLLGYRGGDAAFLALSVKVCYPWNRRAALVKASTSPTTLLVSSHRDFLQCLPGGYFSKEARGRKLAKSFILLAYRERLEL